MNPTVQAVGVCVTILAAIVGGVWRLAWLIKGIENSFNSQMSGLREAVTKELYGVRERVTVLEFQAASKRKHVNGHADLQ